MIDAIDAMLDKLDVVMDFFSDSFYYFLIFSGISTALMAVCIGFIFSSMGKFRKTMQLQKEEIILLKAILQEQKRQNLLMQHQQSDATENIAESPAAESPKDLPSDSPPPKLKDFY